jgi:histidinol-phosphatase
MYEDDLTLAFELADIADVITMARYRTADLEVVVKPDMTPVSESDKRAEIAIRQRLAHVRPDDAVIGEEFGGGPDTGLDADGQRATSGSDGASQRTWVVDPIDGTKSYVRGMDTWSTLVALMVDDVVVVGVVSMPAVGKRWWATLGGGAFADGRRIQASAVPDLSDAQLLWSGVHEWDAVGGTERLLTLARACWRTRGIGDAWQYMMVAEGAAEIAVDPQVTLWDMAAVSIVVEEAGGRFTSVDGVPGPAGGSGLATNGVLHDSVLEFLR